MTDEEVMQRVKNGKVEALAVLFERHHVKLYNYFLRQTGDGGLGEDLTQEVFFRILKYRESYRGESTFTAWMYGIGRNVHMDHLRKHKKETPLEDRWDEEPDPEPPPELQTQAEQESALVNRALELLPPAKKEVLVLSRFQGLKYDEIAGLLGCSLASVKTRVHRAVKDLRHTYLNLKGGTA